MTHKVQTNLIHRGGQLNLRYRKDGRFVPEIGTKGLDVQGETGRERPLYSRYSYDVGI